MTKKAEIVVEEFDNGITTRWNDGDNIAEPVKSLAAKGEEANCIGKQIWSDVHEIFATQPTDKVIIKIQYMIPE